MRYGGPGLPKDDGDPEATFQPCMGSADAHFQDGG
jgi:hypothetical protein